MDSQTQTELDAAVLRRLLAHFDERKDVQNIELMILAGFCRNCLSNWYVEAAADSGLEVDLHTARERIYGMSYADWKSNHQTESTPEKAQEYKDGLAKHGEAGENWFDKPV